MTPQEKEAIMKDFETRVDQYHANCPECSDFYEAVSLCKNELREILGL